MHKTKSLKENLGDITKDNATSADRETVQDYLDDLKERLEDEKLTDEEKSILEELADEAQEILDRLTETEQAASTEAVDQTKGITSGNVTPEDREMLEQAKEDLEQALKEFGGNLTEEEPDKPAGPEEYDGDEGVVAQTGDSADITPWIALILVSVMSMTDAVIIRRKRG